MFYTYLLVDYFIFHFVIHIINSLNDHWNGNPPILRNQANNYIYNRFTYSLRAVFRAPLIRYAMRNNVLDRHL